LFEKEIGLRLRDVKPMAVLFETTTSATQITAGTGGRDLLLQLRIDLQEGCSN